MDKLPWHTILLLDECRLNLGIEEYCYGRRWQIVLHMETRYPGNERQHVVRDPKGIWIGRDEDPLHVTGSWGIGQCPYQHAASWDSAMVLANHARITRKNEPIVHGEPEGERVWIYHCWAPNWYDGRAVSIPETAEERAHWLAICRLALWSQVQRLAT